MLIPKCLLVVFSTHIRQEFPLGSELCGAMQLRSRERERNHFISALSYAFV